MLWKIFSGLCIVVLAGAAYFSYAGKNGLTEEKLLRDRSAKNLTEITKLQTVAADAKTKHGKELDELTKQRDEVKATVAKVNSEIEEKLKDNETQKKTLEEAQKSLAAINDQIKKVGSVKKLMVEVDDLTKQSKDSEASIANAQQQAALSDTKIRESQEHVKKLQEDYARQTRGQVAPNFTARVSESYPGFGFVVLSKGNSNGMFANALLDVKRGKNVVARVKVREVEPNGSIADLVPGSNKGGDVRPGDMVVPAPLPTAPTPTVSPTPTTAPVTPGGPGAPVTPTPPAAPSMANPNMGGGADPFGAPATTPAAPGAASPAAPAPAAPAATPSAADPFAPTPAAGAAPPAGGAPATPPAAGTPAKPATADPFAK